MLRSAATMARCLKRAWTPMIASLVAVALGLGLDTASAHEAPDEGAEWLMADWMLLTFLMFFGCALVAFIWALRRGYFRDLEDAKYYILRIEEPDYYMPEWAREEDDDDTMG